MILLMYAVKSFTLSDNTLRQLFKYLPKQITVTFEFLFGFIYSMLIIDYRTVHIGLIIPYSYVTN